MTFLDVVYAGPIIFYNAARRPGPATRSALRPSPPRDILFTPSPSILYPAPVNYCYLYYMLSSYIHHL